MVKMVRLIDMVRELDAICKNRSIHKDILKKFAERKRLVLNPKFRTDDIYDLTQQRDKTIKKLHNVFIASPSKSFNLQWRFANFLRWEQKMYRDIEVEYETRGKTKPHKIDVIGFDDKNHPKNIIYVECKGVTVDEKIVQELHGDIKDLARGKWKKAIKKAMLVLGKDSVLDRAGENYLKKYPLRFEIKRKVEEPRLWGLATEVVVKEGYRTISIEVYREIGNCNFKRILESK